jgi:hypothetical protein
MKKRLAIATVVPLVVAGGFWLRQQLLIDGCLDGGGRWNCSTGACEQWLGLSLSSWSCLARPSMSLLEAAGICS